MCVRLNARSWQTIGLILLSLVTVGLMMSAWWHVRPNQVVGYVPVPSVSTTTPDTPTTPSSSRSGSASPTSEKQLRAVFMGDAIVAGTGGKGVRWTRLVADELGWKEINLGRAGTGYLTSVTGPKAQSTCGRAECPSFPEMVPEVVAKKPDVVVLASSSNPTTDLSVVSLELLRSLRQKLPEARIIVLSPLWSDSPYPNGLVALGKTLKRSAKVAGVDYVAVESPLEGHREWIASDGVNPNEEGQQALAEAISEKLANAA